MTDMNQPLEKVNSWVKNSVTLKLMTITILMLLLLIPASMIESIISERERLNNETIHEVSSKWAGSQQLLGPILTIPVEYEYVNEDKLVAYTKFYHILPEELNISGQIDPNKLKRGIYEVVVYESSLQFSGNYKLSAKIDQKHLKSIGYDKAFLTIGVSDLRGIKNQVVVNWDKQKLNVEPGSRINTMVQSSITADLPTLNPENENFIFDFTLNLQGSQNMSFVPVGSTTNVDVKSTWSTPSFNGNFLPDSRELSKDGFTAVWKVLQLNRNFPQSCEGNLQDQSLPSA